MKVRNVKIIANLKGMDKKYQPLYRKVLEHMTKVYEDSAWDDSWTKILKRFKTRLEGELNPDIKKKTDKELALLIFDKIEKDKNGVVWHIVSDFDIRTYNGPDGVLGYGLPGDDITRVNIDYLVNDKIDDLKDLRDGGSNLTHEKYHDRKCKHDSDRTPRRPNSGAYCSGTVYDIAHDILFPKKKVAKSESFTEDPLVASVVPTPIDESQPADIITSDSALV